MDIFLLEVVVTIAVAFLHNKNWYFFLCFVISGCWLLNHGYTDFSWFQRFFSIYLVVHPLCCTGDIFVSLIIFFYGLAFCLLQKAGLLSLLVMLRNRCTEFIVFEKTNWLIKICQNCHISSSCCLIWTFMYWWQLLCSLFL